MSRQADLFSYPASPGYKERGGTSQQAARAVHDADTVRCLVLQVISERPSTADEVAAKLGLSVLTVRPRVSELRKVMKIEPTGERRKNESGRAAAVWQERTNDRSLSTEVA